MPQMSSRWGRRGPPHTHLSRCSEAARLSPHLWSVGPTAPFRVPPRRQAMREVPNTSREQSSQREVMREAWSSTCLDADDAAGDVTLEVFDFCAYFMASPAAGSLGCESPAPPHLAVCVHLRLSPEEGGLQGTPSKILLSLDHCDPAQLRSRSHRRSLNEQEGLLGLLPWK